MNDIPETTSLTSRCRGAVDIQPHWPRTRNLSHVVFDFDGTLSWLRHGWPEIMVDVFLEHYPSPADKSPDEVRHLLLDEIIQLNGKPTIFQMQRFVEMVEELGGSCPDAESLRVEYQRRLDDAIAARSDDIRRGAATPDDFVVWGGRALLERLRQDGVTLVVLSSTVVERVREEAELLELAPFFGRHIYGSVGDPLKFSKLAVFERLLAEEQVSGENLLSFGDGPVEIANTKQLGGVAIAVCSDENENGSGRFDPFKRRQLLDAGADAALPDFRDAAVLWDDLTRTS